MRIAGVNIPDEKKINVALSYIYGVGRINAKSILKKAEVDGDKRTKALTEEEQKRIQKVIEEYKIEGDLRTDIQNNIKRLKEIGAYRGSRHSKNLPARGQRTRSNARTKRGKRVTIGAIKKEVAVKMGLEKNNMAKEDLKKNKKKKGILITESGKVYITATFNNTIVTITNQNGDAIGWSSAGASGFKGTRKSTPFAATTAVETVARKAVAGGLKNVEVYIKGPGSGRDSALRAIKSAELSIASIADITPIPHNGPRASKKRRV